MKKLILVASILSLSLASASPITSKNLRIKKAQEKREIVKKSQKRNLESKAAAERLCLAVQVTCTSAYTCQDWSYDQWMNWANQIQANYCTLGGAYAF